MKILSKLCYFQTSTNIGFSNQSAVDMCILFEQVTFTVALGYGPSIAAKERVRRALNSDRELWRKRPLKEKYMEYAATGNVYFGVIIYPLSSQNFTCFTFIISTKLPQYLILIDVCYMEQMKNILYEKMSLQVPDVILPELARYSSERYADFIRENSK